MQQVISIADSRRLAYVGAAPATRGVIDEENDDWYTPTEWVEAARYTLGGIDLDPFTSEKANERVRARQIFTLENSALTNEWDAKTVWMNPPYTRGLVTEACDRFLSQFEKGNFRLGLVLVNNMTDTKWFDRMRRACAAHVEIAGRISFENAAGQRVSGNTRGQVLFLFGSGKYRPHAIKRFHERMTSMGQQCLIKYEPPKAKGI